MSQPTPQQDPRGSNRARAEQLLRAITEKVFRRYGMNEVSDRAWQAFSVEKQRNVVVLVGEVKKGKSSLANALVGRRGLTPAGVSVTTAIPIALGPANEVVPDGKVALYTESGSTLIDAEGLTEDTRTVTVNGEEETVLRAYCGVGDSKMGPATVIDAPGIGGIDNVDMRIAHDSAAQASVVVVVTDATAPLTRPEMNYIRAASEATESIVVTVTKTDKNLTRWREIVDKDRELLAEHVGRDVPVIGVSSLLPTMGVGRHSGDDPATLEELSGIVELRRFIHQQFRGAENIPAATGLRIAVEGLQELDQKLVNELQVINEGASVVPELTADLDRLQTIKSNAEQWDLFLNRDLTRARQAALQALDDDLAAIRKKWTDIIDNQGMRAMRKNPGHYTSKIEQDFQTAAMRALTNFTARLEKQVIAPRFPNHNDRSRVLAEIQKHMELGELKTSEFKNNTKDSMDPMILMMGFSGGSLAAGAAGSTAVAALLGPIGILALGVGVGVSWIGINVGFRSMRAGKQKLTQWIRETMGATKAHVDRSMSTIIAYSNPVIKLRFNENIKAATTDLRERIKKAQEIEKQDREKRRQDTERVKKNRAVIGQSIQKAEAMRAQLAATDTIPEQRQRDIANGPQLAPPQGLQPPGV